MSTGIRPEWIVLLLMWSIIIGGGAYVILSWVQTYQAMTP